MARSPAPQMPMEDHAMQLSIPELAELRQQVADLRADIRKLSDHLADREPVVWDTKRVAQHYGVTTKTLRKYVHSGKLKTRRNGGKMTFDPESLPETLR